MNRESGLCKVGGIAIEPPGGASWVRWMYGGWFKGGGDGSGGAHCSGKDRLSSMCSVWVCLEGAVEMARFGGLADV